VATTNNEKINGVNKEYMAGMKAIDQAQGGLLLSKDILKNTQS
jgi:hypothetical protein